MATNPAADDTWLDHNCGFGAKTPKKIPRDKVPELKSIKAVPSFSLPKENPDPIYGIENLVFAGAGAKGDVYGGVAKKLDELGILAHCKRFGGASAGSIVSMCLAVAMPTEEIEKLLNETDMRKVFFDDDQDLAPSWGNIFYFRMWARRIQNLLSGFGFFDGNNANAFLSGLMEKQTGCKDITFQQVYERYGRELCVVVGNTSLGRPEFFHPKTTPNMPVWQAVRMSINLPFIFEAYKAEKNGKEYLFTDGGIFDNYPVHIFDGWFLSMKPEDAFHIRIPQLDSPLELTSPHVFEPLTTKTLGFSCMTDGDMNINRAWGYDFLDAIPADEDSTLAKKWRATKQKDHEDWLYYQALLREVMHMMHGNKNTVSREELYAATRSTRKTSSLQDFDHMWAHLEEDCNGNVSLLDLVTYFRQRGFDWKVAIGGEDSVPKLDSLKAFSMQMISSLQMNNYRKWYKSGDEQRSVCTNLRYIKTVDFELQPADKKYMVEAGKHSVQDWADWRLKEDGKTRISSSLAPQQ